MEKIRKVILSNMCLLYQGNKILVVDRCKKDWPGISLPGGHVEDNETLIESVIREIKEETNLDIYDPQLIGTMEWDWGNNTRYIALLYKTNKFKGQINSSKEGEIFWLRKDEISSHQLSTDFDKILDIYEKSFKKN